jgi:anti-anti-sigma regulatory factor
VNKCFTGKEIPQIGSICRKSLSRKLPVKLWLSDWALDRWSERTDGAMDARPADPEQERAEMIERFTLPARLDTSAAASLVQELLPFRGQALEIDASAVEVLGARAAEVIIAAGRQWAEDGIPFAIVAMSERYSMTCDALGLSPEAPWVGNATLVTGSTT